MVFLGAPHATTTDDVYRGYFIPKGLHLAGSPKLADCPDHQVLWLLQIHGKPILCLYISRNDKTVRAMTHDETKYPSPDEFKPERFLREDGSLTDDKMHIAFGWGRRIW